MSERDEPYRPAGSWADQTTVRHDADDWREQTTPGITPVPGPSSGAGATAANPTVGGYPSPPGAHGYEGERGYGDAGGYGDERGYGPGSGYGGQGAALRAGYGAAGAGAPAVTAPDYTSRPVAFRRPDAVAALLLLLAGVAAGVSLLLPWVHGNHATGWDLMRTAWQQVQSSKGEIFRTGLWQPAAIVVGGAVLFVLGLLLFIPARTHRFLGVLALLVSVGVAAGVLVPLSKAGWHVRVFDLGFWFAVAVAVLGILGALKALLTGPRRGPSAP